MEEVQLKKAKTHKGRMFLENRKPKAVEDPKKCAFINTHNSNEILRMVLNDLVLKNQLQLIAFLNKFKILFIK